MYLASFIYRPLLEVFLCFEQVKASEMKDFVTFLLFSSAFSAIKGSYNLFIHLISNK